MIAEELDNTIKSLKKSISSSELTVDEYFNAVTNLLLYSFNSSK